MKLMLLLAFLLTPICAAAQPPSWTPADKALLATSTAMLIVDWGQTRHIAKNPQKFHEINPILGEHPSVGRVNTYFVTVIIGNALVAHVLGQTNRKIWLGGMTVLETAVVIHNNSIGIKINF